jgi:hypothetical protein
MASQLYRKNQRFVIYANVNGTEAYARRDAMQAEKLYESLGGYEGSAMLMDTSDAAWSDSDIECAYSDVEATENA